MILAARASRSKRLSGDKINRERMNKKIRLNRLARIETAASAAQRRLTARLLIMPPWNVLERLATAPAAIVALGFETTDLMADPSGKHRLAGEAAHAATHRAPHHVQSNEMLRRNVLLRWSSVSMQRMAA
jgi:hypothetical protein